MTNDKYHVIGLMSGTSLDGLDIAHCTFLKQKKQWSYKIVAAETFQYTSRWKELLSSLDKKNAIDLAAAHSSYGHLIGKTTKRFIDKHRFRPDFIASHGHTIFHQPQNGFSFQLGNGAAIEAECAIPVICDFRTTDIALGGQGAPLVPVGDKLLFSQYEFCLNLGGFANVSYDEKQTGTKNGKTLRKAYDICPANFALNYLARKKGKSFDKNGRIAKAGKINAKLLNQLNRFEFYKQLPPKSLGKEWFDTNFLPLMEDSRISLPDKMRTLAEHTAIQIGAELNKSSHGNVLVTGGGVFNSFLISRIQSFTQHKLVIPDSNTINFKEALIFAFLGVLRWRNENNCLASVTGARRDCCGGSIFY